MHPAVLFPVQNHQILKPIVQFVAIDVVNFLLRRQSSPKVPLHHQAMNKPLLATDSDALIPIPCEPSRSVTGLAPALWIAATLALAAKQFR